MSIEQKPCLISSIQTKNDIITIEDIEYELEIILEQEIFMKTKYKNYVYFREDLKKMYVSFNNTYDFDSNIVRDIAKDYGYKFVVQSEFLISFERY